MGCYCRNVFKAMQIHHVYFKSSKMLNIFLFLAACLCIPLVISWRGLMLGPGEWLVLNIVHCDNPEEYEFNYEISRKKINRTHDCFDITLQLEREFNSSFGFLADIFQKLDGGFKYYQTISDDCACTFIMKHAEDNVKRALAMANIHPPECPYRPGPIIIRNFVMDYSELPKHAIYGTFQANVYATYEEKKIGCVKIILNFDKRNDDDYFDLL